MTTPAVLNEERVVVPEADKVVKAAVDGVVAPIAVPLIPVAVVLKFAAVISRVFAPVLILEEPSPESVRAPDVAVKFRAPVVWVKPLEAVRVPAEEIAPVPVVETLPEVERTPFSLIVRLFTPPDWIANEVLTAAFVSFMMKAVDVPALVKVKDVEAARPLPRVKSIFRPVVVRMVFPES
jgi:hypothetical protein